MDEPRSNTGRPAQQSSADAATDAGLALDTGGAADPRDSGGEGDSPSFDALLRAVASAPSVRPLDLDLEGRKLDRYSIGRRIGRGGMGVVYEARHDNLGRTVALKVLRAFDRGSGVTRDRLLEEAKRLARLSHPNIAAVYDAGEDDGIVFLALERVQGRSLRERLREDEPLTVHATLALLRAIASGLACAHREGIVHRDLKPENVVAGGGGAVKIIDFGIAALAGTGACAAGTRGYMAPEQAAGAPASPREDVFAFGVLARDLLKATVTRVHERGARSALQRLAADCCDATPEARPRDGDALVARLEKISARAPVTPRAGPAVAAIAAAALAALAWPAPPPAPSSGGAASSSPPTATAEPDAFGGTAGGGARGPTPAGRDAAPLSPGGAPADTRHADPPLPPPDAPVWELIALELGALEASGQGQPGKMWSRADFVHVSLPAGVSRIRRLPIGCGDGSHLLIYERSGTEGTVVVGPLRHAGEPTAGSSPRPAPPGSDAQASMDPSSGATSSEGTTGTTLAAGASAEGQGRAEGNGAHGNGGAPGPKAAGTPTTIGGTPAPATKAHDDLKDQILDPGSVHRDERPEHVQDVHQYFLHADVPPESVRLVARDDGTFALVADVEDDPYVIAVIGPGGTLLELDDEVVLSSASYGALAIDG